MEYVLEYVGEKQFRQFVRLNADAMKEEKSKTDLLGEFTLILYGNTKSQLTIASEVPVLDEHRYAIWRYPDQQEIAK